MGNVIKINDGFKTYDIQNQDGKLLGQFSFNPADTNIIKRYNDAVENFASIFDEVREMGENADTAEVYKKLDEKTYELIDGIFNADVASNFFQIMGPFSPLANGEFFVASVIGAIGQALEAELGERVKRVNSKINKHTSKYHK